MKAYSASQASLRFVLLLSCQGCNGGSLGIVLFGIVLRAAVELQRLNLLGTAGGLNGAVGRPGPSRALARLEIRFARPRARSSGRMRRTKRRESGRKWLIARLPALPISPCCTGGHTPGPTRRALGIRTRFGRAVGNVTPAPRSCTRLDRQVPGAPACPFAAAPFAHVSRRRTRTSVAWHCRDFYRAGFLPSVPQSSTSRWHRRAGDIVRGDLMAGNSTVGDNPPDSGGAAPSPATAGTEPGLGCPRRSARSRRRIQADYAAGALTSNGGTLLSGSSCRDWRAAKGILSTTQSGPARSSVGGGARVRRGPPCRLRAARGKDHAEPHGTGGGSGLVAARPGRGRRCPIRQVVVRAVPGGADLGAWRCCPSTQPTVRRAATGSTLLRTAAGHDYCGQPLVGLCERKPGRVGWGPARHVRRRRTGLNGPVAGMRAR